MTKKFTLTADLVLNHAIGLNERLLKFLDLRDVVPRTEKFKGYGMVLSRQIDQLYDELAVLSEYLDRHECQFMKMSREELQDAAHDILNRIHQHEKAIHDEQNHAD